MERVFWWCSFLALRWQALLVSAYCNAKHQSLRFVTETISTSEVTALEESRVSFETRIATSSRV